MITLSIVWIVVTAMKQDSVKEFSFNYFMLLLSGILDIVGVIIFMLILTGAR